MHRIILGPMPGEQVDHIDGDGLNNRRSNLRVCDNRLNQANKAAAVRNRLGVKGVQKYKNQYCAFITPAGRRIHLGLFPTIEEASAAYIGAARVLWGPFARK